MGLPEIFISFQTAAVSAITRSARGVLAVAVKDATAGGATEDAKNVWGGDLAYLKGKEDPYEALVTIPGYRYTTTYTKDQLTWVLQNSGYSIGTVEKVYVSDYTAMGNVYKVTFVDSSGRTLTVQGDKCRTIFYSSTLGKSVKSLRFTIDGQGAELYINDSATTIASTEGAYAISGKGTVTALGGEAWVLTSSGKSQTGGGSSGGRPPNPAGSTGAGAPRRSDPGKSRYRKDLVPAAGRRGSPLLRPGLDRVIRTRRNSDNSS